jgi:hypothetical protein
MYFMFHNHAKSSFRFKQDLHLAINMFKHVLIGKRVNSVALKPYMINFLPTTFHQIVIYQIIAYPSGFMSGAYFYKLP